MAKSTVEAGRWIIAFRQRTRTTVEEGRRLGLDNTQARRGRKTVSIPHPGGELSLRFALLQFGVQAVDKRGHPSTDCIRLEFIRSRGTEPSSFQASCGLLEFLLHNQLGNA